MNSRTGQALSPCIAAVLLSMAVSQSACTALDAITDPAGTADRIARDAAREAANEAAREAGRQVGQAVGEAIVRHYTPQFMGWYASYLTQMAFNTQWYAVETATQDYHPGEYTEWQVHAGQGDGQEEDIPASHMKRAFLEEDSDGNQWWQVIYYDTAGDDTIIMEALFTPDREELIRLRAQFPDDEQARELNPSGHHYRSVTRLDPAALEEATEGRESIRVPAGRFDARRISLGSGQEGQQDWWLNDQVPGGVVRFALSSREHASTPDGAEGMPTESYVLELSDYGADAERVLR